MDKSLKKMSLLWIARVLSLLFAFFLVLLSFDVFNGDQGFWKNVMGFIMHLIPAIVVVFFIILGWKKPWLSGISFILLGLGFIFYFRQNTFVNSLVLSAPLFLNGILFLIVHFLERGKDVTPPGVTPPTDITAPH